MRRLTPYALRAVSLAALLLLLWNPALTRDAPAAGPPLVLLDASLSMAAPDVWAAALDTAGRAARGGLVWRFGTRVAAFDSAPPGDGATRLAPALAAAAARPGPVVLVTDGELDDAASLAPDLLARPRVALVPRAPRYDAFVARVLAPRRVAAGDTVRLEVAYGAAGPPVPESTRASGATPRLAVHVGPRVLLSRPAALPDSGVLVVDLALPAALLPAGSSVIEVRLEGHVDDEPRDDARLVIVEVSPEPAAVLLATPPDWETRFLAAALDDVVRVPLRTFVRLGGEVGGGWRDGHSLRPVPPAEVERALRRARLVVRSGGTPAEGGPRPGVATLVLAAPGGQEGEWYVRPPGPSPVAGALAGIDWDALPPATALGNASGEPPDHVVLAMALARRGAARPAVVLDEYGGARRATIHAAGLWRWQFRGGRSAVAYRALVAGLVDWLLAGSAGRAERMRAAPESPVVANGLPLVWRWAGAGDARELALRITGQSGERQDTLQFDGAGRAELRLPPGVYRYAALNGPERGLVAVETYSDEWRPKPVSLGTQPGSVRGRRVAVGMREQWWLYVIALGALVGEWAWRRRQGLP